VQPERGKGAGLLGRQALEVHLLLAQQAEVGLQPARPDRGGELGQNAPVVEGGVERVRLDRVDVCQAERGKELAPHPKKSVVVSGCGRSNGKAEEGGVPQFRRIKAGDQSQGRHVHGTVGPRVVQKRERHAVQRRVYQRKHHGERHWQARSPLRPLAASLGLPRPKRRHDQLHSGAAHFTDRAQGDRLAGPVQGVDVEA